MDAANNDEDTRPALRVEFAGGHRIAVETEAFIRRESIVNTVGSLALILPLLYFVFRSPWLVVVGPLPSALSLIVVLGILGFRRRHVVGRGHRLGRDAVRPGRRWRRAAVRRRIASRWPEGSTRRAAVQAIAEPSKSMLLGMWTTAATFYGLMFVDFPSLQELGRLVGHSMVVCGLATLFLVPATLPRDRRARAARACAARPRGVDRPASNGHHRADRSCATILLGVAATRIRVNPTLERLRSVTDAAALEARIGSTFGLPGDVSVIVMPGPRSRTPADDQ